MSSSSVGASVDRVLHRIVLIIIASSALCYFGYASHLRLPSIERWYLDSLLVCLFVLCISAFAREIASDRRMRELGSSKPNPGVDGQESVTFRDVVSFLLLVGVYVWAFLRLGFLVSTVLFVVVVVRRLGHRRLTSAAVLGVVIGTLLYLIFCYAGLPMPSGYLL